MKKTGLGLALVLTVLIMFGVQFVQIVKANAYILTWETDGPPIITLESPLNNETVTFNNVAFAFTLTRPSYNWTFEENTNRVVSAYIILDGTDYRIVDVNSDLSAPFTYSLNLTDLKDGAHSVELNAYCRGVSWGEWTYGTIPKTDYYYNASSGIVNFIVDTPEPTPYPSPELIQMPETIPATLVFVASVGIALAAIGLFVYFKKHK